MSKLVGFRGVLAALTLTTVAVAPAVAAPGSQLTTRLDAERSFVGAHEDVAIRYTISNPTDRDLSVVYWQTALRGIKHDLFDVRRDGERIEYIGPDYKWATPRAEDFVVIPAGGSVSAQIELSSVYDIAQTGEYTIRFRLTEREQPFLRASGSSASNVLALAIERDARPARDLSEMLAAAPFVRFQAPSFVGCSTSRQNDLAQATGGAESISGKALNYFNAGTNDVNYTTWFGAYNSSRYNSVKSHYTNIKGAFTNQNVTYHCDCTDSAYAYVFKNQPYNIHLCNAFWSAPQLGIDSKAGTLVHEMSHFTIVADTDDWAYGTTACKSLASRNAKKAIDNADSHEYFAETRP